MGSLSDAGEGADVANTDGTANLKIAYDQLCTSYRAIDDFRAKLLGFLPLVTGGGLIVLTGQAAEIRREFFKPVGLFGIAVTTGLLAYELFGIKKCHALLKAGEDLERELGLPKGEVGKPAGQFIRRPNHLLGVVNEPLRCRGDLSRRARRMDIPGVLLRRPPAWQSDQSHRLRRRVRRHLVVRPISQAREGPARPEKTYGAARAQTANAVPDAFSHQAASMSTRRRRFPGRRRLAGSEARMRHGPPVREPTSQQSYVRTHQ
jgi:hypothetical protein